MFVSYSSHLAEMKGLEAAALQAHIIIMKRAVIAVVNNNGKILLGKKRSDSPKVLAGEWHVLGETVEDGETDEEALRRCLREEVNLSEIVIGRYLGSHITPTNYREARWYECFSKTDEAEPRGDLEDAQWVSRTQVPEFCGQRSVNLWPDEVRNYFR